MTEAKIAPMTVIAKAGAFCAIKREFLNLLKGYKTLI
jgi:hypothetical protein